MPDYSFIFDQVSNSFPEAKFLYVMRDPRRIAKSYLSYKNSEFRQAGDYWIKDSADDAFKLIQKAMMPLNGNRDNLIIIKYEEFVINPVNTLNRAFKPFKIVFSKKMLKKIGPMESYGKPGDQFLDNNIVLPWKKENLSSIKEQRDVVLPDEIYSSEAWKSIETLAHSLGYK